MRQGGQWGGYRDDAAGVLGEHVEHDGLVLFGGEAAGAVDERAAGLERGQCRAQEALLLVGALGDLAWAPVGGGGGVVGVEARFGAARGVEQDAVEALGDGAADGAP